MDVTWTFEKELALLKLGNWTHVFLLASDRDNIVTLAEIVEIETSTSS